MHLTKIPYLQWCGVKSTCFNMKKAIKNINKKLQNAELCRRAKFLAFYLAKTKP